MTPETGLKDSRTTLLKVAEGIIAARKRRSQLFPRSMFAEPAWDILLALYVRSRSGTATPTSELGLVGTPTSTLVRWINYLENEHLVTSASTQENPIYEPIRLTDKACRGVETYLRELAQLMLSIG